MQQIRDAWPDWIVGFVRMKPAWDRFAGHTTKSHLGTERHLQRLTLSDPGQATLVITELPFLNPWIDYDVRFWFNSNKVFKPEDPYSGWYQTKETSELCIAIIHTSVADIFLRQININHANICAQYNLKVKPDRFGNLSNRVIIFLHWPSTGRSMYGIVDCKLPPRPHVAFVSLAEVKLISLISPVTRIH